MVLKSRKKAVFFSTDALIALTIIFFAVLMIYPVIKYSKQDSFIEEDMIKILSKINIGDFDNSYARNLISEGKITKLNQTIMEQIGEFYITNRTLAEELSEEVLSYINTNENIGIWYGTTLIASKNSTPIESSNNIEVDRQMISGIQEGGETVTGFAARAFLSNSFKRKYFYFGGYSGDGNISANLDFDGEIQDIKIEIATSNEFDVYINNNFSGHYAQSPSEFIPASYNLDAYISNFHGGNNTIKFVAENLYIAGGFLKIGYNSSGEYETETRIYFPGIEGAINIYSGLHIPGELSSMTISLHMDTNYSAFLTIGNQTVFNDSTNGEETIILDDLDLSSILDYSSLAENTFPVRLGLENVSYTKSISKDADVYSVTDLSGSMVDDCVGESWICCFFSGGCTTEAKCGSCSGTWVEKISAAKDANSLFIDSVLNNSRNRVGLVGYKTSASATDYHFLSNNSASLKSEVSSWTAGGNTCICCGINKAVSDLVLNSSSEKYRSMVVMSDGEANVRCAEQGTPTAKEDAIQAACDAYNHHNITIHAIGFGTDADEPTLQSIADCGHGEYYLGDSTELSQIYQQVAENIIEASYNEQTIETTGDVHTILYPDSYIDFTYSQEALPHGLIVTDEKQFDDNINGEFSIPEDSSLLDAKVISYSGPRWTSEVNLNNNSIYMITNFGREFTNLGDPYSIFLPTELINQTNYVSLFTEVSPQNYTSGSQYNKIIYTVVKNISAYSEIVSYADGCVCTIEFDDDTNTTINIPAEYSGTDECFYTESRQEYNENDASQNSIFNLLRKMDLDSDNKIDIKFSEQDIQISLTEIIGIPYTWSTEVQVRRWY